jgi:hypothetical protein
MGDDSPRGYQEVDVKHPEFLCVDCGYDTWVNEYYMVKESVWRASGMKPRNGMLCIGCLETRLSRPLNATDFSAAPINFIFPCSERLVEAKARRPHG